MLRIGVDCHVLDGIPQGSSSYLSAVLEEWGNSGKFNGALVCVSEEYHPVYDHPGLKVEWIQLRSRSRVKRLLQIPRLLKSAGADAAWYQYAPGPTGWFGLPFVVTIHDLIPLLFPEFVPLEMRLRFELLVRAAVIRSASVVTVSESSARDIQRLFRAVSPRVSWSHLGLSTSACRAAIAAREHRRRGIENFALFLGRSDPRRPLEPLVQALSATRAEGMRLVLAGAGTEKEAARYNEDWIVGLGRISEDKKWALLAKCRFLVYPSVYEGFGIPILEAAAVGTPVIAGKGGAQSEVAQFGNTITVDPLSAEELAAAITDLANNPPESVASPLRARGMDEHATLVLQRLVEAAGQNTHSIT